MMFFTCQPIQGAELRASAVSINTACILGVLWRKDGMAEILSRSPFPDLTLGTHDADRLRQILSAQVVSATSPA